GATADHDVMWLFSQEGTTSDYDNGWDGRKLAGDAGTARIQAVEGNSTFQIDVVPDINNTIISARAGKNDTQYKLKIVNENMLSEYNSIYLLDTKTNTMVDISQSETEYLFTMTNTSSEPRFKILTSAGMTTGLANTSVNYSNGKLICPNWDDLSEIKVFDIRGVEVSNLKISDLNNNALDIGLNKGVYILKITTKENTQYCTKIIVE
ncbi:MAG: T9SS type A sorting domain-containing protein, partial [Paludibacter sp.]